MCTCIKVCPKNKGFDDFYVSTVLVSAVANVLDLGCLVLCYNCSDRNFLLYVLLYFNIFEGISTYVNLMIFFLTTLLLNITCIF